ncbi:FHA domain-containing protein, partial [Omnitrophica bacterium]|nr:FHA domain-containing protein [Candidatus Omnitrophota bacterium]
MEEDLDVPGIQEVLLLGNERRSRAAESAARTGFLPQDETSKINSRSKQWTLQSPQELRQQVSAARTEQIFPAILVYEAGSPDLLAVYILDYLQSPPHAALLIKHAAEASMNPEKLPDLKAFLDITPVTAGEVLAAGEILLGLQQAGMTQWQRNALLAVAKKKEGAREELTGPSEFAFNKEQVKTILASGLVGRLARSESREHGTASGVFHNQFVDSSGLAEIPGVGTVEFSKSTVYPTFLKRFMDEFKSIRPLIPAEAQGEPRLISLGLGNGLVEQKLREEQGFQVTGIELSKVQAGLARERGIRVYEGDANKILPQMARAGEDYDVAVVIEALGFMPLEETTRNLSAIVRDGGLAVISTYPVKAGDEYTISPTGYMNYPTRDVISALKDAGFGDIEIRPIKKSDPAFAQDTELQTYVKRDVIVNVIVAKKLTSMPPASYEIAAIDRSEARAKPQAVVDFMEQEEAYATFDELSQAFYQSADYYLGADVSEIMRASGLMDKVREAAQNGLPHAQSLLIQIIGEVLKQDLNMEQLKSYFDFPTRLKITVVERREEDLQDRLLTEQPATMTSAEIFSAYDEVLARVMSEQTAGLLRKSVYPAAARWAGSNHKQLVIKLADIIRQTLRREWSGRQAEYLSQAMTEQDVRSAEELRRIDLPGLIETGVRSLLQSEAFDAIDSLLLYGSALGDVTPDSDIDVYVVIKEEALLGASNKQEFEGDVDAFIEELEKYLKRHGVNLEIQMFDYGDRKNFGMDTEIRVMPRSEVRSLNEERKIFLSKDTVRSVSDVPYEGPFYVHTGAEGTSRGSLFRFRFDQEDRVIGVQLLARSTLQPVGDEKFFFFNERIKIGTREGAIRVIEDNAMAGLHFGVQFHEKPGKGIFFQVTDLGTGGEGSLNGTFVTLDLPRPVERSQVEKGWRMDEGLAGGLIMFQKHMQQWRGGASPRRGIQAKSLLGMVADLRDQAGRLGFNIEPEIAGAEEELKKFLQRSDQSRSEVRMPENFGGRGYEVETMGGIDSEMSERVYQAADMGMIRIPVSDTADNNPYFRVYQESDTRSVLQMFNNGRWENVPGVVFRDEQPNVFAIGLNEMGQAVTYDIIHNKQMGLLPNQNFRAENMHPLHFAIRGQYTSDGNLEVTIVEPGTLIGTEIEVRQESSMGIFRAARESINIVEVPAQKRKASLDQPAILVRYEDGRFHVERNPRYRNPQFPDEVVEKVENGIRVKKIINVVKVHAEALREVLRKMNSNRELAAIIKDDRRRQRFEAAFHHGAIQHFNFSMQQARYEGRLNGSEQTEQEYLVSLIEQYVNDMRILTNDFRQDLNPAGLRGHSRKIAEDYAFLAIEMDKARKPYNRSVMMHRDTPDKVLVDGELGSENPDVPVILPAVYVLSEEGRRDKDVRGEYVYEKVTGTNGETVEYKVLRLQSEKIVFARWQGRYFMFYSSRSHTSEGAVVRTWRHAEAFMTRQGGWLEKESPENKADVPVQMALLMDEALLRIEGPDKDNPLNRKDAEAFFDQAEKLGFLNNYYSELVEDVLGAKNREDLNRVLRQIDALEFSETILTNPQLQTAISRKREEFPAERPKPLSGKPAWRTLRGEHALLQQGDAFKITDHTFRIEWLDQNGAIMYYFDGNTGKSELFTVKGKMSIGRDPHNDFVIKDETVSRFHTSVSVLDGVFRVEDMGSRNKTHIRTRSEARREADEIMESEIERVAPLLAYKTLSNISISHGPAKIMELVRKKNQLAVEYRPAADQLQSGQILVTFEGEALASENVQGALSEVIAADLAEEFLGAVRYALLDEIDTVEFDSDPATEEYLIELETLRGKLDKTKGLKVGQSARLGAMVTSIMRDFRSLIDEILQVENTVDRAHQLRGVGRLVSDLKLTVPDQVRALQDEINQHLQDIIRSEAREESRVRQPSVATWSQDDLAAMDRTLARDLDGIQSDLATIPTVRGIYGRILDPEYRDFLVSNLDDLLRPDVEVLDDVDIDALAARMIWAVMAPGGDALQRLAGLYTGEGLAQGYDSVRVEQDLGRFQTGIVDLLNRHPELAVSLMTNVPLQDPAVEELLVKVFQQITLERMILLYSTAKGQKINSLWKGFRILSPVNYRLNAQGAIEKTVNKGLDPNLMILWLDELGVDARS